MSLMREPLSDACDAAAARWLARRQLGLMTPQDEARFQAWISDPANAAAYEAVCAGFDEAADFAAAPEIMRMREAALAAGPTAEARSTWRRPAMAAAAALVALASAGLVLRQEAPSTVQPPTTAVASTTSTAAAAPAGYRHYESGLGERRDIRLDDGSVVTLDTDTQLEVGFSPRARDLRLLRGQALFKVASNKEWPFIVTAGDRRVTALGTQFGVRVDGEGQRVKVVLVEGRVAITPTRPEGLARILPALAREELEPGEQLITGAGDEVEIAAADVARATSWRSGQIVFRDDPLSSAVAEMNRYSQEKLVVTDPRVAALRVSGVFRTSQPANFVAAITTFYPVEVHRRSPRVTELVWRGEPA